MARKVALVAAVGLTASACGGEAAQLPTQQPLSVTSTRLVGGTKGQRALVRQVLAGMGRRRIATIRIGPAPRTVRPFDRGNVSLALRAKEPDLRALWEAWLVAGTFDFLSAKRGLPRVAYVEDPYGGAGGLGWGPEVRPPRAGPPRATASAASDLDRWIRAAAKNAGAKVTGLQILRPYGLAPAITLRVEDPAAFLRYRLTSFQKRLDRWGATEGVYLWVDDSHGEYVFSEESATRGGPGAGGVRPELEGCAPGFSSRGVEEPAPPPCPV
jgi:hypothetical protein